MNRRPVTLGDTVRDARVRAGKTLRALASDLSIAPAYLSDIENNRRVPAEDVLRRIASSLQLDFDELMAMAGRFGEQTDRYLKREPLAGILLRRISQANLDRDELRRLVEQVEGIQKEQES